MTDPGNSNDSIPELTLGGNPGERGLAHGEQLRDMIGEAIGRWFETLSERTDPSRFVSQLVNETGFLAAAKDHAGELVEEVRGIADGSGQSFETMFAWQLIDEAWWYLDELTGSLQPHEACSAMAVNRNGRGFVAQTQDLPRHFDGSQVMLRYEDRDGLEVLVPSAAGLLAYNGVNSAGLAVCITTLSQLAHSPDGLSSGLLMPTLVRCTTIDEALAFLRRTPIASGNSWTLGSRDRSVVVEASASGISMVDDGPCALHTNHALTQVPEFDYLRFDGSVARFDQLKATIRPDSSLDEITEMYRTGPVCQSRSNPNPAISVATMIFEVDDGQRCHLAPGPLDTTSLTTYAMSDGVG